MQRSHPPRSSRRAFSLVELSIVLVILGLLVGGVLSGQSLIRAAELRAVTTEYNRYTTATRAFRDKYFALPGDMANATNFWGTAATCPGVRASSRAGVAATCNGDGDGKISATAPNCNEYYCFWEHLTRAGLIEGSYSGTTDHPIAYDAITTIPGTNLPLSKLSGASWAVVTGNGAGVIADLQYIDGNDYGTQFMVFGQTVSALPANPIISAAEAWNVDTKIDDGKAGTGKVIVYENHVNCYTLFDGSPGTTSNSVTRKDILYNLTNSNKDCALVFKNPF